MGENAMAANNEGMQVIDSPQTEVATVDDNTNQGAEEAKQEQTPVAADSSDKKARTKGYSDRINKIRAEAEKKNEELSQQLAKYKQLEGALHGAGYSGKTADELLYEITAANEGITPEEARKKAEAKAEQERQAIESNPAIKKANEIIMQHQLESDLSAIKAAYPDVDGDNVFDLGDEYISLMATGRVDALTAYEVVRAKEERNKKPVPPSTGDIKPTGGIEKEYYTPEEVDALPSSAYDDPKIFEKIRKSMLKWKK